MRAHLTNTLRQSTHIKGIIAAVCLCASAASGENQPEIIDPAQEYYLIDNLALHIDAELDLYEDYLYSADLLTQKIGRDEIEDDILANLLSVNYLDRYLAAANALHRSIRENSKLSASDRTNATKRLKHIRKKMSQWLKEAKTKQPTRYLPKPLSSKEDQLKLKKVFDFMHRNEAMAIAVLDKNPHLLEYVLQSAASYGRFNLCKYLLDKGISPNTRGQWGRTPLFHLANSPALAGDLAKLLLARGADPAITDDFGWTALDYVQIQGARFNVMPQITDGIIAVLRQEVDYMPIAPTIPLSERAIIPIRKERTSRIGFGDEFGNVIAISPPGTASFPKGHYSKNGLLAVGTREASGWVDRNWKFHIPLGDKSAGPFFSGLAAYSTNEKRGYLNEEGKVAIEARYDQARPFDGELAFVEIGKEKYLINQKGEHVARLFNYYDWSRKAGDPYVIRNEKGAHGYLDATGKILVPAQYKEAEPFVDGIGIVQDKKAGQFGAYNTNGKLVLPFSYDGLHRPGDGLIIASDDKRTFYINHTGKVISDSWKTSITGCALGPFSEGRAVIGKIERGEIRRYLIDKTGTIIKRLPRNIYITPSDRFFRGRLRVRLKEKYGFIDREGEFVTPPVLDRADPFSQAATRVSFDNFSFWINLDGRAIIHREPKATIPWPETE